MLGVAWEEGGDAVEGIRSCCDLRFFCSIVRYHTSLSPTSSWIRLWKGVGTAWEGGVGSSERRESVAHIFCSPPSPLPSSFPSVRSPPQGGFWFQGTIMGWLWEEGGAMGVWKECVFFCSLSSPILLLLSALPSLEQ